jgi:hypothetical protein
MKKNNKEKLSPQMAVTPQLNSFLNVEDSTFFINIPRRNFRINGKDEAAVSLRA